ncbi:50S ribosomal protein L7/L12 [Acetohalobium arabaticum]|uniref:Large ribosomal subunit protein bL12 n=1 Tax=Acetohalobium arabaticum (strain ATCC 49924 / DSM 5501 / Z-7288) TaxID=574087 RepID=D9QTE1_ACEAZ|nr:50S ribosomal protein L7/L12 [Acetohalobium arabaticum]ADL11705.1 LSU ribosomal protein L12P [Acetohalobium arabaticum DSM 5501]
MDKEEIMEAIENMTVLELAELVEELEEKFDVSAAAPVAMAGAPAAGGDAGDEEEQTAFDVEITSGGDKKIKVIKAVREVTDLGLKDAKALVDEAPNTVKEGLEKEEAEEIKEQLEEAGATVELK